MCLLNCVHQKSIATAAAISKLNVTYLFQFWVTFKNQFKCFVPLYIEFIMLIVCMGFQTETKWKPTPDGCEFGSCMAILNWNSSAKAKFMTECYVSPCVLNPIGFIQIVDNNNNNLPMRFWKKNDSFVCSYDCNHLAPFLLQSQIYSN